MIASAPKLFDRVADLNASTIDGYTKRHTLCGELNTPGDGQRQAQFHLVYADRVPEIRYTSCSELAIPPVVAPVQADLPDSEFARHRLVNSDSAGAEGAVTASETTGYRKGHASRSESSERPAIRKTPSDELGADGTFGFAPSLSWSHYRLLMRVAIDLKIGKLTQDDLGQMQLYVNYCDRELCAPDDNPTAGLILCTDRNEAMVRYTLPKGQDRIHAARYRTALPSEEELVKLLRRDWDILVREQGLAYRKAEGQ